MGIGNSKPLAMSLLCSRIIHTRCYHSTLWRGPLDNTAALSPANKGRRKYLIDRAVHRIKDFLAAVQGWGGIAWSGVHGPAIAADYGHTDNATRRPLCGQRYIAGRHGAGHCGVPAGEGVTAASWVGWCRYRRIRILRDRSHC